MKRVTVFGDPRDANFPASRIAKQLGLDYPDVDSDPDAEPEKAESGGK